MALFYSPVGRDAADKKSPSTTETKQATTGGQELDTCGQVLSETDCVWACVGICV